MHMCSCSSQSPDHVRTKLWPRMPGYAELGRCRRTPIATSKGRLNGFFFTMNQTQPASEVVVVIEVLLELVEVKLDVVVVVVVVLAIKMVRTRHFSKNKSTKKNRTLCALNGGSNWKKQLSQSLCNCTGQINVACGVFWANLRSTQICSQHIQDACQAEGQAFSGAATN